VEAPGWHPSALTINPKTNRIHITDDGSNAAWMIQERRFGLPAARIIARADAHTLSAIGTSCRCD